MTEFARLLSDHMQREWPPKTIPEWAERFGVSAQAVYDWFEKDTVPRASTLDLIHQATGIARGQLYRAAGRPLPSDAPWQDYLQRVEQDKRLSSESRMAMVHAIKELQQRYSTNDDVCEPVAQ